jgi:hypothetical protein
MWEFRPRRRISTLSPGSSEPVIFNPSAALLLRNGLLLVLDPSATKPLLLMKPEDGTVVARFGATGEGPGELGDILTLAESDGRIEVLDSSNRQLHRFSLSGDYLGSSRLTVGAQPWGGAGAPDGHGYLAEVVHPDDGWRRELVRIQTAGGTAQPLAVPLPTPGSKGTTSGIQSGRALWAVVGTHVVTMWSAQPSLEVYDENGTLVRQVQLPLTRRDLTERDIAQQVKRYGSYASTLRPGSIALTNVLYPAGDSIVGMFMTALWHAAEDPPFPAEARYWRLFTLRGEYVGVVRLPDDFWFLGTEGDGVWARVLDESMTPVIVELELARAPRDLSN